MGLAANLSTAQIVEQMVVALRVLREREGAELDAITNVVFMGMGEPLHNLDSVLAAVEVMTHPRGLGMSHNKVRTRLAFSRASLQSADTCPATDEGMCPATGDGVYSRVSPGAAAL
jgi:adenine C2-methylase RlmN of 23S rRNA A2503 and tRNA A37